MSLRDDISKIVRDDCGFRSEVGNEIVESLLKAIAAHEPSDDDVEIMASCINRDWDTWPECDKRSELDDMRAALRAFLKRAVKP